VKMCRQPNYWDLILLNWFYCNFFSEPNFANRPFYEFKLYFEPVSDVFGSSLHFDTLRMLRTLSNPPIFFNRVFDSCFFLSVVGDSKYSKVIFFLHFRDSWILEILEILLLLRHSDLCRVCGKKVVQVISVWLPPRG